MKFFCPVLLASVLSGVPSAPRSESVPNLEDYARIAPGETEATLMICHALTPEGGRLRVAFRVKGEGDAASLRGPILIDTNFGSTWSHEVWPAEAAHVDISRGGSGFTLRGHSDQGGTLWWRRRSGPRDTVDEADVHLPTNGIRPEFDLRLTGKPGSVENSPPGTSGGCTTILNPLE